MKNTNLVTSDANGTLVNPTPFENELNKLAVTIKGNEFSLYCLVSHELTTVDESIVKPIFERIMVQDNGFNPSTVARYFTDIKKLSNLALGHVTLQSYLDALKELHIVNMPTANLWISRESAVNVAIRDVNQANRNALLSQRNGLKNASDVRILLNAIKSQAKIDQAAKDQAKIDQAAKDQAAKDQAAKDQAAKDQAAKDQAAKDQAAKDQAAKDQAAKDQAAKDQAEIAKLQAKLAKRAHIDTAQITTILASFKLMSDEQLLQISSCVKAEIATRSTIKKTGTK